MSKEFLIPTPQKKVNINILAKGFGLPLVKQALLNIDKVTPADKPEYISDYGTAIYDTLFIQKPEVITYDFNPFTKTYQKTFAVGYADNFELNGKLGFKIDGCIIDVTQNRNIVTTEIMGQNGSVKEFINNGDASITIRGYIATNTPDLYPESDVRVLSSYCNAECALPIVNRYLNSIFQINSIVITGSHFFQQEGMRNIQYFEINALSDINYLIETNNA